MKKKRVGRNKLFGTEDTPRVCVFRSNKHIYAQVINDEKQVTIASSSDIKFKTKGKKTKTEIAEEVGNELGKILKKAKVEKIKFDRGSNKYHGRVKALAEGIRAQGIKF